MDLRIQPVGAIAIKELVTKLGWLESQVRRIIIEEVIKPCMWLRNRTNNHISFHEFDNGFLDCGIRYSKLSHFDDTDGGGGVAGDHWYYLRQPRIVDSLSCEFVLASRNSDSLIVVQNSGEDAYSLVLVEPPVTSDEPGMVKLDLHEDDLSWILLEKPITLDEVLEQGFFQVMDLQKIVPSEVQFPQLAIENLQPDPEVPDSVSPIESIELSHREMSSRGGKKANAEVISFKADAIKWLESHATQDHKPHELTAGILREVPVVASTAKRWRDEWRKQKGWM